MNLLTEYVRLVVETSSAPVFRIENPRQTSRGLLHNEYTIQRSFPLQLPGGEVTQNHTVVIDVDAYYTHAKYAGEPDDFDINDWNIVSVDGINLSMDDALRLKSQIPDLTDEEISMIEDTERDREPYFDEPDNDDRPDDYDRY